MIWIFFASLSLFSMGEAAVHSFDCFDTLVGRLHGEPGSVFGAVEETASYPGFAVFRKQAEANASDKSLNGIYEELQKERGLSDRRRDELRTLEFQEELRSVFPIKRNLALVQDGDLVVSDTYFSEKEVQEILRAAGLQKQVHIVVSYHGKQSGQIWKTLKEQYQIEDHIGDNALSDFASPLSCGIAAKRFSAAEYSPIEKETSDSGHRELACLMRALRLQNPYAPGSEAFLVWNEQAEFNVPILILASQYLNALCTEKGYTTILFSERGCCHWRPIFQTLFPSRRSVSFAASRILYKNPSPEYLQYVRLFNDPNTVIVDDHGSGQSVKSFFQEYFSKLPSLLYLAATAKETPGIVFGGLWQFELLNEDRTGTIVDFNSNGPVRAPLEFAREHVDPAFACVDLALSLLEKYRFQPYDVKVLFGVMSYLFEYKPVFLSYHVEEHSSPGTGFSMH